MGRGPHPSDAELFSPTAVPNLRRGCAELSWLLDRGYAERSAVALVGDRHRLTKRQRTAISRSACTDASRATRIARRRSLDAVAGTDLAVDGFNCVITVEAALAGGVLLRGRDTALRDLASVHGSYRRVDVTERAVATLLAQIARHSPARVIWWLDRPVSNSGRLRAMIEAEAETLAAGGPTEWDVRLDFDPDKRLRGHAGVVASSDCYVLDGCEQWVDLPGAAIESLAIEPWCIDLDVAV